MTFCLVQKKYNCICLGFGQTKKTVRLYKCKHCTNCTMETLVYSVHIVQTVQCTHCTNLLLESSTGVLCTHSTTVLLSYVDAVSSWAGPEPPSDPRENNLPQGLQRGERGP